ncbi:GNAT family N-acetyltransferase [Enterococcus villorum]|uniref:GNAT family N-acetyltransferase n=2 Tax=Enterococcus villorum TaxID=112904 RepID=A0A1V8YJ59_9ENTE|nr:GNAT family N-acetyltransferase [Enterococcus villorum]OQO72649.1 GNAT family N-acetyltransferase [Enterococcus villorum]
MMKIEMRRITIQEVETLQAVSIETYRDTFGQHNSEELMTTYLNEAYEINKLTQELQDKNTEFYWALLDGQIAGYLKLNINQAQTEAMGNHFLEIERIYIRPSFQANGIGSKFIELAVEKAREKQKEAIWLGVWEHNYTALNFYKKHGFSHQSQHIFYMGDDPQTDYLFVKNLNE